MLFSIITVCRNSAKTIRRTLDSVLDQDLNDCEYLVIDGESTDGTVDIIREYEPKFQGRMRWISEKDSGIYNAMNKASRMAKGEFLAFINSDDSYDPGIFASVKAAISRNQGFDVYYGVVRNLDPEGNEILSRRNFHGQLKEFGLEHPGTFTRRERFLSMGGFDEKFRIAADYDLFLRIFLDTPDAFYPMDLFVANYRLGGFSAQDSDAFYRECLLLKLKNNLITKRAYRITSQKMRYTAFKECFLRKTGLKKIWNAFFWLTCTK